MRLFLFIAEWEGYYYLTIDRQIVRKFKLDRWMALHRTTLTRSRAPSGPVYGIHSSVLAFSTIKSNYHTQQSRVLCFSSFFSFFPPLAILLLFSCFSRFFKNHRFVTYRYSSLSRSPPFLSFPRDLIGCGN